MCIGAFSARGSEAASRPTQFGDFPRKDALDARLPPPASRRARSGDRSHDLLVAISPVEFAGDPVCVRVDILPSAQAEPLRGTGMCGT